MVCKLGSANFAQAQKSGTDLFVCAPGWMGLGPRVGSLPAHACGPERSSGNPELKTKPGFRMSLMKAIRFIGEPTKFMFMDPRIVV